MPRTNIMQEVLVWNYFGGKRSVDSKTVKNEE